MFDRYVISFYDGTVYTLDGTLYSLDLCSLESFASMILYTYDSLLVT